MWIYYYATHGPGHQGIDDGFVEFHDDATEDEIKEHIFYGLSDYYDIVLNFWKIEKPSGSFLKDEIKDMEEEVKRLQESIKSLKKEQCFFPQAFPGPNREIQEALKYTFEKDVLRRLHKEGLMFTHDEINEWRWGKVSITGEDRDKILKVLEEADRYTPGYEQLKKKKNNGL